MNDKKVQIVLKSNALVEARYRLTLQEQHIVLWLLSQIKPEDEDFKKHHMQISEFAKIVGLRADSQYGEIQKTAVRLMQRVMKIYESELDEWLHVSWLSSARYRKKQGILILEFSPELKPYLLQLKRCFTKINLADAMSFKSIYAIKIYELLMQYLGLGRRKMTIEELRTRCGIEGREYVLYSNLKKEVFNRAKTEINTKTDYVTDFVEIKQGRKVVAINWTISHKPRQTETPTPVKTKNMPTTTKKTLTPGDEGYTPPKFELCKTPEMLEFCKIHEPTLRRELIDYLVQVVKFNKTKTTLELTFATPFFREKADDEEAHNALTKHFKVKHVEMI